MLASKKNIHRAGCRRGTCRRSDPRHSNRLWDNRLLSVAGTCSILLSWLAALLLGGGCASTERSETPEVRSDQPTETRLMLEVESMEAFQQAVVASPEPVLVEFYQPRCARCILLAPVIESLAAEYRDRVRFVRINASKAAPIVQQLKIIGTPTLLFFHQGKEVDRMVGGGSESEIREVLDSLLREPPTEQQSPQASG